MPQTAAQSESQSEKVWEERMDALREFAKREGHTRVPAGHIEYYDGEEINLGSWVSYLRTRYRKEALEGQRRERLEQLPGWKWGPLRPGPRSDIKRDDTIREKRRTGMSLAAIGEEYGLSRQRIHQIISQPNGHNA